MILHSFIRMPCIRPRAAEFLLDKPRCMDYNGFYQGDEETSSLPGHDLQRASGRCEEAFVPKRRSTAPSHLLKGFAE